MSIENPKMMVPGKVYTRSAPTSDGNESYIGSKLVFEGVTAYGQPVFRYKDFIMMYGEVTVFAPFSIYLPTEFFDGNWEELPDEENEEEKN